MKAKQQKTEGVKRRERCEKDGGGGGKSTAG